MNILKSIWNSIQHSLFPWLEEELEPLSEKERQFIEIISLLDLVQYMKEFQWCGNGRKPKSRLNIMKAFVAKAVYNFETTEMLIEYLRNSKNLRRLCGWENSYEVPSEATFSRAFSEFSSSKLVQQIHEAMVKKHCGSKLAGHVSRDSTAIEVREKPEKKENKTESEPKRKQGRPCKGEVVSKPPKRMDLQLNRNLDENLKDLPNQCDVGTKINSKGYKKSWIGYKLHIDCIDGDIPISAILTSASLHDSQAAIPLAQMTSERVTNLYDLMDAAYDAPQIKIYSAKLGHVPIIDQNPRRGEKILMDNATKKRFGERTSVERINSNLKDNHGGSKIRVKGAQKVMTHLMFGIVVITATQIFRLLV
jgi:transposase